MIFVAMGYLQFLYTFLNTQCPESGCDTLAEASPVLSACVLHKSLLLIYPRVRLDFFFIGIKLFIHIQVAVHYNPQMLSCNTSAYLDSHHFMFEMKWGLKPSVPSLTSMELQTGSAWQGRSSPCQASLLPVRVVEVRGMARC